MKKYNFYAGPAILPKVVMEQASQAALDFNGIGLSILELSHRSKEVVAVFQEAELLVYDLLGISKDDFAVLFLSGGASSQFFMSAMNLLGDNEKAGYVDTGSWSSKAIKEAKNFGEVQVLASSKAENYNHIPKNYEIPGDLKYLHLTSNNTIFGTQYQEWPETNVPLVSDMSSDIFSRELPMDKFDIIYAGAQKNIGPAGVTLAVVRKSALGKVSRTIPTMLNYQTHIDKESMFNTPPVFPTYVAMLTFRWIKAQGGVKAVSEKNDHKAQVLYDEIDRNSLFYGTAAKEDRSKMNVCFLAKDETIEKTFLEACAAAGCIGVKGHRSVGGFRASIYNAMELEGVETLVQVMKDLETKHG